MAHSFTLKLDRAREHLQSLDMETRLWVNAKPYGIVDEPDPEVPPQLVPDGYRAQRFRISRVSDIPDRFSLLIGDCLFNLRSSLDHLALTLALAHTPSMSDKAIRKSQFPVFGQTGVSAETEKEWIGCISAAGRAAILALQPHHRGNGYATHPLWQIHQLNNIDKHRKLTVCATLPQIEGARAVALSFDSLENYAGHSYFIASGSFELELDAIWVRWAARPINADKNVSMNPDIPLETVFRDGPATSQPVIKTLESLCDFVGDVVIAQLSQFL